MNPRPFGRRGEPLRQVVPAMTPVGSFAQAAAARSPDAPVHEVTPLWKDLAASSFDDDLEQWKQARKQKFEIPWRPLSLLASVFFAVGSFALPDFVNDTVQWPLYGLAAMSFWVGCRRRQ